MTKTTPIQLFEKPGLSLRKDGYFIGLTQKKVFF